MQTCQCSAQSALRVRRRQCRSCRCRHCCPASTVASSAAQCTDYIAARHADQHSAYACVSCTESSTGVKALCEHRQTHARPGHLLCPFCSFTRKVEHHVEFVRHLGYHSSAKAVTKPQLDAATIREAVEVFQAAQKTRAKARADARRAAAQARIDKVTEAVLRARRDGAAQSPGPSDASDDHRRSPGPAAQHGGGAM